MKPSMPQSPATTQDRRPLSSRPAILFWGTYDVGKPRVRLLLSGARSQGAEVRECHRHVWGKIEDKGDLKGGAVKIRRVLHWISSYPSLWSGYLRAPDHDAVVVPYLGHLDVLLLAPLAKLRRKPLVWDAFLSLYDTVVHDRGLLSPESTAARLLFMAEKLSCRAADILFLDTHAQARYFERTFRLKNGSVGRVFVGAEDLFFRPTPNSKSHGKHPFTVLFYGQFIPLHGIETIVKAALRAESVSETIRWVLVGRGQEAERVDAMIARSGSRSIERVAWVPYDRLPAWIHEADVGLGIFGTTGKAQRVIPNKIFQMIAAGIPIITADTPAIRELVRPSPFLRLIPPGDPNALAEAVLALARKKNQGRLPDTGHRFDGLVNAKEVGRQLMCLLRRIQE